MTQALSTYVKPTHYCCKCGWMGVGQLHNRVDREGNNHGECPYIAARIK